MRVRKDETLALSQRSRAAVHQTYRLVIDGPHERLVLQGAEAVDSYGSASEYPRSASTRSAEASAPVHEARTVG